eukprot:g78.t1
MMLLLLLSLREEEEEKHPFLKNRPKAQRDPSAAPVRKLTVNLIQTYKHINKVYYAAKEKRLKKKSEAESGSGDKNSCDDENYNYIIQENEVLADRYIVECRIGKGSFGQVVRALDRTTKRLVAIKIIKSRSAFTKQAQTEISVLKFLNKKDPEDRFFIVRLLDAFVHRNHTCLVFEHLSYNLYDLLRNTSFHGVSLNLVRKFGLQILQSLRFLSAQSVNVIHCDLKPENILLRHPRRSGIKVIDFGSSCYGDKPMYKYIQSRFYRSPEVILGLKYSTAIDVWSLGCVLVEMHTGEPLFNGSDEADQIRRIMEILGPIPKVMMDKSPKIAKLGEENSTLKRHLEAQAKGTFVAKKSLEQIIGVDIGGPGGRRKGEAGHDVASYKVFVDLIRKLLRFRPETQAPASEQRLSALDALRHPFFASSSAKMLRGKKGGSPTGGAGDSAGGGIRVRSSSDPVERAKRIRSTNEGGDSDFSASSPGDVRASSSDVAMSGEVDGTTAKESLTTVGSDGGDESSGGDGKEMRKRRSSGSAEDDPMALSGDDEGGTGEGNSTSA